MKPPEKYSGIKIEPLVIYWMPLSNTDELKPFFRVPISDFNNPNLKTSFNDISLFSVSLYLRELRNILGQKSIQINMPNVEKRLEIIRSIVEQD